MNAKSRIFAFLAALTLMVSMSAGATAETKDVSVQLGSPTVCGIESLQATGDFGTWYWVDAQQQYVRTSDSSRINFTGKFLPLPWGGCNVTVEFGGLSGVHGTIPALDQYFTARSYIPAPAVRPTPGWTDFGLKNLGVDPSYDFNYELDSVPSDLRPGWYSGTVVIGFANAV